MRAAPTSTGFELSARERDDLIEFLHSLTAIFLVDARSAEPAILTLP